MESLIIDKEKIINKIDNIISELNTIKNDIKIDNILEEVINVEDIKDSNKFEETEKTLKAPKKMNIKKYSTEETYHDYYDPNARPNIYV